MACRLFVVRKMILTVIPSFETVQSLCAGGANKETVIMASVGQCSGPQEISFIGDGVRVCVRVHGRDGG